MSKNFECTVVVTDRMGHEVEVQKVSDPLHQQCQSRSDQLYAKLAKKWPDHYVFTNWSHNRKEAPPQP